jgi:flagellar biogenesis protein FliO
MDLNLTSTKSSQMGIVRTQPPVRATRFFAVARLKVLWRSVIRRAGISRQHKALAVRETATLGDRRFVSVVQFERQRFLIGSSPSSITLLAQLPDEFPGSQITGEKL